MVSGVCGCTFTELSLSHFEEGTLILAFIYRLVVHTQGTIKQVFCIYIFDIIPWTGPLVQYWEVLSCPVK